MDHVNLIKLSVGTESVEGLIHWQRHRAGRIAGTTHYHVTRMWPRREAEVLAGGSIYWVIQGLVQCRQRITGLEEVRGEDGIRRCAILLSPEVTRTEILPRRPFQGWRYLKPEDAPRDAGKTAPGQSTLPPALAAALAEIGVR